METPCEHIARQNDYGDTVCRRCSGDFYACECSTDCRRCEALREFEHASLEAMYALNRALGKLDHCFKSDQPKYARLQLMAARDMAALWGKVQD